MMAGQREAKKSTDLLPLNHCSLHGQQAWTVLASPWLSAVLGLDLAQIYAT